MKSNLTLPKIFNEHHKARSIILLSFAILVFYLLTNNLAVFREMNRFDMTLEDYVPFVTLSIWVYFSYYPSVILYFLVERDISKLNCYAYALLFLNLTSNLVFLIYPVAIQRYDLSTVEQTGISFDMVALLYDIDKPVNCFPSLHVANLFLLYLFLRSEGRSWATLVLLWTLLISWSTLALKQHYIWDVLGGLVGALLSFICFKHLLRLEWTFTLPKASADSPNNP